MIGSQARPALASSTVAAISAVAAHSAAASASSGASRQGATDEQQRKIDASALAPHFEHVHIVAEKDVDTYRDLARTHDLAVERTWMVGNSPKSDIAPARAAGLRAVYIPNVNTWALEHADLDPTDDGILQLRAITELLDHF